jgi:valyl-tRNA synthetase
VSEKFTLSKTYDPAAFEEEISDMWLKSGGFRAVPDGRERTYVIMMPLPNVTGALHMGHAMDNVMQDMLIRWHRMLGDNTLWMPGTDHAGIATQAVVEKRIKELEGLTRHDVGREGLVERIWKWKDQFQARIYSQLQRIGCSADWDRARFTMDRVCSRAVRHAFFKMFKDGLVFRGKRLVNWDPILRTSISDDEVYHETVSGHFWNLKYPVIEPRPGDPHEVVVATTRPETMLGDTAVAVHPEPEKALDQEIEKTREDLAKASPRERKALETLLSDLETRKEEMLPDLMHLRDMARAGRKVMLPLLDRPIPLICDEWAKPSLGTGCVKITPAHDYNDYDVWTRHKDEIDIINILNDDGSLNRNAGPYAGQDRFEARKNVVADLKQRGLLGEIEDRQVEIGHSDRSKTPIEPYLSDQWFVRMGDVEGGLTMGRGTPKEFSSPGLVQAAIDAANDGRVSFHPERFRKTYLDWLEEKRDWVISRQLWWGHRIPVWSRRAKKEELAGLIGKTVEVLGSIWPEEATVRVVNRDEQTFARVNDPQKHPELSGSAQDAWLLDVCLLGDDPGAVPKLGGLGFEQDPDVLDTWFSSALWPHSTLGWPDSATADTEGGADLSGCLEYYYPGSCLVTARDIITLWVARMVITGLYNLGDVPFADVFIHANILDGKGERMSKSKGNGIDPVDIVGEYGTDAMRYVLCDMQTGNQDIRLPVTAVCPGCQTHNDLTKAEHGRSVFTFKCEKCQAEFDVLGTMPDVPAAKLISERFLEGSKFCNKLWNAARFAISQLETVPHGELKINDLAIEDRWILAALNQAIRAVTRGLEEYNPSIALGAARDFLWNELCDWYLELIKPRLADPDTPKDGTAQDAAASAGVARQVLAYCLGQTLRLLHPFVPFVTEHLYQQLNQLVPQRALPGLVEAKKSPEMLLQASWPQPAENLDDAALLKTFADLQTATTGVRDLRATHGVSPGQAVEVSLRPAPGREADLKSQAHVIQRLANVGELHIDAGARRPAGAASKMVGEVQIFLHGAVDDAEEKQRLQEEIERVEKEIGICEKKLFNEKFTARAPAEVVQQQRDRLSKYQQQKEAIERALAEIG